MGRITLVGALSSDPNLKERMTSMFEELFPTAIALEWSIERTMFDEERRDPSVRFLNHLLDTHEAPEEIRRAIFEAFDRFTDRYVAAAKDYSKSTGTPVYMVDNPRVAGLQHTVLLRHLSGIIPEIVRRGMVSDEGRVITAKYITYNNMLAGECPPGQVETTIEQAKSFFLDRIGYMASKLTEIAEGPQGANVVMVCDATHLLPDPSQERTLYAKLEKAVETHRRIIHVPDEVVFESVSPAQPALLN